MTLAQTSSGKAVDVGCQLNLIFHALQNGSPAGLHSTETSEMKDFSQSAESRMPWSSDTQWPTRIIPLRSPAVLASNAYSTHNRQRRKLPTRKNPFASRCLHISSAFIQLMLDMFQCHALRLRVDQQD